MNKSSEFPYPRHSAYFDLIIILIIALSSVIIAVDLFGTSSYGFLAVYIVCLLFLVVFGISPLLTSHEIVNRTLVLKRGLVFRAKIPLTNIDQIIRVQKGPVRRGVFFSIVRPELFVTSARYNLIRLNLKRKQRFVWALGKKAEVVYFDVIDTDGLLRVLENHIKSIRANQFQEF